MFFAESLGPAITRRMGAGMLEHLQQRLAGRGGASAEELGTAISEFIRTHGLQVSADAAIQYLVSHGHLARQGAGAFRLAA